MLSFALQQMTRHEEGIRNHCRNNSAADHGGDQERILGLIDDAVVETE